MEKIKQQGLTLLELMVTIAIIAILASIAVPSFKTMIVNNRIEATANRLRNTFIQARNKAIESGALSPLDGDDDILAKASVMVEIRRNAGSNSSSVTYAADGSLFSTNLNQIVYSICQDGQAGEINGVRNKAVILFPSGLAVVKGQQQMVAGDTQSINCL